MQNFLSTIAADAATIASLDTDCGQGITGVGIQGYVCSQDNPNNGYRNTSRTHIAVRTFLHVASGSLNSVLFVKISTANMIARIINSGAPDYFEKGFFAKIRKNTTQFKAKANARNPFIYVLSLHLFFANTR